MEAKIRNLKDKELAALHGKSKEPKKKHENSSALPAESESDSDLKMDMDRDKDKDMDREMDEDMDMDMDMDVEMGENERAAQKKRAQHAKEVLKQMPARTQSQVTEEDIAVFKSFLKQQRSKSQILTSRRRN